jgi:hypothetical protein
MTRSLHNHTWHHGLTTTLGISLLEVSSDFRVSMNSISNFADQRESLIEVISLLNEPFRVIVITKSVD